MRKFGLLSVWCGVMGTVVGAGTAAAAPLTLAEGGEARAVIVVAEGASAPVRHAAGELARFLGEVTGGEFAIEQGVKAGRVSIAVGPGAARMLEGGFEVEGLGRDGMVMRVVGERGLILAGGEPRGTLNAVFGFLEEEVGCRWWSSKASTIPSRPTLRVAEGLDRRVAPELEYRYPFWTDAFDADWSVRNRVNGSSRLDEKRGGRMSHGGVHTFYRYIRPDRYFDQHPEWFSEIDGERRHERAQLCLTNEAMRTELVKNLRAYIDRRPSPPVYSVSQNDWHGYCTCAECSEVAGRHGGQSGLMVWFVNRVAEEIERTHPEATISTLAYQYTRRPPVGIRPRRNVVIQLSSIECSFSAPLTSERNASFRDDIVGWSKAADRLYIWDYTTNFRHHFLPHPNLRVLGPNVRFFVEHNAKGIFEQGAYTTLGAEFAELRAWVLAKLLWNPKRDDGALIEEFCNGYYGPAGPYILRYIDVIHDAAEAGGEPAHCLPSYRHRFDYLTFDVLNEAWGLMGRAAEAVAGDAALAQRVEMARLPVTYAFLWRWGELRAQAEASGAAWPLDDDPRKVGERFKEVARAAGVTRVNEWNDGFGLVDRAVERAVGR